MGAGQGNEIRIIRKSSGAGAAGGGLVDEPSPLKSHWLRDKRVIEQSVERSRIRLWEDADRLLTKILQSDVDVIVGEAKGLPISDSFCGVPLSLIYRVLKHPDSDVDLNDFVRRSGNGGPHLFFRFEDDDELWIPHITDDYIDGELYEWEILDDLCDEDRWRREFKHWCREVEEDLEDYYEGLHFRLSELNAQLVRLQSPLRDWGVDADDDDDTYVRLDLPSTLLRRLWGEEERMCPRCFVAVPLSLGDRGDSRSVHYLGCPECSRGRGDAESQDSSIYVHPISEWRDCGEFLDRERWEQVWNDWLEKG